MINEILQWAMLLWLLLRLYGVWHNHRNTSNLVLGIAAKLGTKKCRGCGRAVCACKDIANRRNWDNDREN